jgi:hypothetical protein
MAFFSKETHSGELMIDHRASPGIPAAKAESMGFDPRAVREGAVTRLRTLGCCHCGGVWVENPWRTRPRNDCFKCDRYVCDSCAIAMREPDYVHRSFQELADMLRSGNYKLVAGDLRRPVLIRST